MLSAISDQDWVNSLATAANKFSPLFELVFPEPRYIGMTLVGSEMSFEPNASRNRGSTYYAMPVLPQRCTHWSDQDVRKVLAILSIAVALSPVA